jgi:hypothetical protein
MRAAALGTALCAANMSALARAFATATTRAVVSAISVSRQQHFTGLADSSGLRRGVVRRLSAQAVSATADAAAEGATAAGEEPEVDEGQQQPQFKVRLARTDSAGDSCRCYMLCREALAF